MRYRMEKKIENPNVLLLEDIQQDTALNADIFKTLIQKTEDNGQKNLLRAMLVTYENFAGEAKNRLREMDVQTKSPGILKKLPSEVSVTMSTLTDRSDARIAELVIENAVMGVSEWKEKIRNADEAGADLNHIRLAGDLLSFQEEVINKMRRYL